MVESLEKRIMLFFLDLDHTILDTAKLREKILALIGEWAEEYRAIEGQMINSGKFTMEGISRELARRHGVDEDELWARHREILETVEVSDCVFPGVRELLSELKARGYEIGIWSQGDPWWQQEKLRRSGLLEFVDPDMVLIGDDKIALLDQVPNGAMIVDDSPRNLQKVHDMRPDIQVFGVDMEEGLTNYGAVQLLCFQEI